MANMTSILNIVDVLITYSKMMTHNHSLVKHGQNHLPTSTRDIFWFKKSDMTSILQIENVHISYAKMMTHCYSRALINAHPLSPTITHYPPRHLLSPTFESSTRPDLLRNLL